jgi:lipopolysaccharide transport system permease protein
MAAMAHNRLRSMLGEFSILLDRYYLMSVLLIAHNSISRQYRDSILGVVWMLILPLMQVVIYAVIMPLIMRTPVENYVLYLVTTFPLWSFIASSLVSSTKSLVTQAETLKRCTVSKTIFPVADVLRQFYTCLVSYFVMLVFAMLWQWHWNPYVLLLPFYLIPVLVSITALSVGISFVAPYVRDVTECIIVGTNIMFWFTPVVYPITMIPAHLQPWFYLNPFYILMRPSYLLGYMGEIPGVADTLMLLGVTTASVAFGYSVYRLCRRNFIYYL